MDIDELWTDLENWGRDPVLSELDALMWRTDRHPEGAWSGVILQLLDVVPEWERLRAAHEWFVEIVPRFAQRVVDPVLPVGPPMWEDDPSFDLDFHLRRISLPAPGTHRQLLEFAQTIGLTPLDRSRAPSLDDRLPVVVGPGGGAAAKEPVEDPARRVAQDVALRDHGV